MNGDYLTLDGRCCEERPSALKVLMLFNVFSYWVCSEIPTAYKIRNCKLERKSRN